MGWPIWIAILWKWTSMLIELPWDGECRRAWFHVIRNFLTSEIFHFSRLFTKHAAVLLEQHQLLIQPLLLFQNAIFHKILKLGFWNFKPIFLRMQFLLVATFSSLVLVISLSWYFHLTISYLTLVTWQFGSQMVFPNT